MEHMYVVALGGQEKALDNLELATKVVSPLTWVLRTELKSSGRIVNSLSY